MAEWPIAPVLKIGNVERRSRVRIPPPPLSIARNCRGQFSNRRPRRRKVSLHRPLPHPLQALRKYLSFRVGFVAISLVSLQVIPDESSAK